MLILIAIETTEGCCGCGKKPSGSTKYWEFFNQLRNSQLFENDSAPMSQFSSSSLSKLFVCPILHIFHFSNFKNHTKVQPYDRQHSLAANTRVARGCPDRRPRFIYSRRFTQENRQTKYGGCSCIHLKFCRPANNADLLSVQCYELLLGMLPGFASLSF